MLILQSVQKFIVTNEYHVHNYLDMDLYEKAYDFLLKKQQIKFSNSLKGNWHIHKARGNQGPCTNKMGKLITEEVIRKAERDMCFEQNHPNENKSRNTWQIFSNTRRLKG